MKPAITMIVLLFLSSFAVSASFDCSKAASNAEKLICSDPELSRIDEQFSAYYKSLIGERKKYPDGKGVVVIPEFQRNWLTFRDLCESKECMADMYALQMSDLVTGTNDADDSFRFFRGYDPAPRYEIIFRSYGIKRGATLAKAIEALRKRGWSIVKSSDAGGDGVSCGSGWGAVCYTDFKRGKESVPIQVYRPAKEWLVISCCGAP